MGVLKISCSSFHVKRALSRQFVKPKSEADDEPDADWLSQVMTSHPELDADWLVQVLEERQGFKIRDNAGISIRGIAIDCTCRALNHSLN